MVNFTVNGALKRRTALLLAPLEPPLRQTVAAVVKNNSLRLRLRPRTRQVQANPIFLAEEVVRDRQVSQVGLAYTGRNGAAHHVVAQVQLLQVEQARHAVRNGAHDLVKADVEHFELVEKPYLLRQTAGQVGVREDKLFQRVCEVYYARRYHEFLSLAVVVVGEDEDRSRGRRGQRLGDVQAREAVVVDEDGVELLGEEFGREWALEVVEADVEVV
ncbi:LOW QUALITY PROTEIN: hypothetical protein TorRG33x02_246330 [Trema orientale]|uniref:Uncharacterized protein n=1 Tax=Trema orientale TaxID=63057 RepID=A0A2P5DNI1_TREOI|nr:LOW QUALITY PROTEIN: hypothetical protein TorRG33x02_246330 [Trema orientale]